MVFINRMQRDTACRDSVNSMKEKTRAIPPADEVRERYESQGIFCCRKKYHSAKKRKQQPPEAPVFNEDAFIAKG